jgi:GT2 family glycosyltransferase
MAERRIAVVMITRDRRAETVSSLARLRGLPERPHVVVVDNGSSDGTPRAVTSAFAPQEVTLIAAGTNLGAAGRNLGVRAAGTPYVAFADDDSWWAPGALRRAADLLAAHPGLALLQGRILVGPGEEPDPVCEAMARSPLPATATGPGILGFVACGAVVRADAFLDAGGFAAPFGVGGEEERLAIDLADAGHELAYVPEVVAHHHPSAVRDPASRRRRLAVNAAWTALQRCTPARVVHDLRGLGRHPSAIPPALAGAAWCLAERRPSTRRTTAHRALLDGYEVEGGNHLPRISQDED